MQRVIDMCVYIVVKLDTYISSGLESKTCCIFNLRAWEEISLPDLPLTIMLIYWKTDPNLYMPYKCIYDSYMLSE